MIRLSNGHSFEYMVASGALAFDGKGWPWERPLVALGFIRPELFTVVIKTLTRHPRAGNLRWWRHWDCVRLIDSGSVNKIGLTNPGIEWWCEKVAPTLDFRKVPFIGSIFGEVRELVEMTEMLNRFHVSSVMEFEDIAKLRKLGARAVSFGAIHLRTPWKPTEIVERDMGRMKAFQRLSL